MAYDLVIKNGFVVDGTGVPGHQVGNVIGIVKEKETARREYRQAVEQGHGAYLLEEEKPDVVSVGRVTLTLLRTASVARRGSQTLARLRTRQTQIDLTARAIQDMEVTTAPDKVLERLAEAGCGAPLKTSADDVLARLTRKAKKKKA